MAKEKTVIKKYENRRLYDTSASRYVNLDEIGQMVRQGVDVQVVDAATGEDITRLVLTQIIMEGAKGQDSAFPLDMLRQMIVASGAASQEAMLKYMKTTIDMYQNAYRALMPMTSPLEYMQSVMGSASSRDLELEKLQRRVEELEKMLAAKSKKPKNTA